MDKQSLLEYISNELEKVKSEMCDNYCKHPVNHTSEEWENVQDDICYQCPLSRL